MLVMDVERRGEVPTMPAQHLRDGLPTFMSLNKRSSFILQIERVVEIVIIVFWDLILKLSDDWHTGMHSQGLYSLQVTNDGRRWVR